MCMRKWSVAMIVMIMLISVTGSALAASVTVHIIGNCNVRTTPSINSSILGTVSSGSTLKGSGTVRVDSRGVAWHAVTYGDQTGWVSSKYAYTTGSTSQARYVVGDTGDSNVRTGPDMNRTKLGVLKVGDAAKYLNETSVDYRGVVWYKIQWKGESAWVSSKYTRLSNTGSGSSDTVVADSGDTYVRTGPGKDYGSFDIMYYGDEAAYLNKSSVDSRGVVWYKISWYGDTGWVSSKYTSLY